LRRPVSEFLCRDWNSRHPPDKQIAEFELILCSAGPADRTGLLTAPIRRERLFHQ
jgi:hypothetical protein